MALSGSIDYSLTAREVIDYALKKLRVLAEGETALSAMANDAMRELNVMLKGWQKHEHLWLLTEGSITVVAATASYTLSPQPHRVISARFDDQDSETPMILMTREEYFDLPNKTASGIPTQYYVDYQRASTAFYVWPLHGTVDDETINYTYVARIDDIDALDDDINIRQEFLEVCGYQLASRLADDYGRSGPVTDRLIMRAEALLQTALDEDREDEIRFVPEPRYG
jgi:hypothetical protein